MSEYIRRYVTWSKTIALYLLSIMCPSIQEGDRYGVTEEEFNEFCDGNEEILLDALSEQDVTGGANKDGEASAAGGIHPSLLQPITYENTYRTEPTTKFLPDKVAEIISTHLEESLCEVRYSHHECGKMACELSERIKEEVKKKVDLPRRKLVSFVTIGELRCQGARVGSRCIWNEKTDRYASASYKNSSLFAVGVVFAVFHE